MYRLTVSDLDSPSYFVATAACELGTFASEGIDIELVTDARNGPDLLRLGRLHFFGGAAYAPTRAFPRWEGVKLICALAQYSYWFLGVRSDLDINRGEINALKGLRISSSTGSPGLGLRHMLKQAGIDPERDVRIIPSPSTNKDEHLRARDGVDAILSGAADAFWGNGMRLAVGESLGVAKLHMDLRRGDGPPNARYYNFAAFATTDRMIAEHRDVVEGAVRAIVQTQRALAAEPALAKRVAQKLLPPEEAELITTLVARDAPFYQATISQEAIGGLNDLALSSGLISKPVAYDDIVAAELSPLWAS